MFSLKKILLFTILFFLIFSFNTVKAQDLDGKIFLQVESHGEAWYVNPEDSTAIYLRDGNTAYDLMRELGLGITNENISKIPIGLEARFEEQDSDNDGLSDKLEEVLKSDLFNPDTDYDGNPDGQEIREGYNIHTNSTEKLTFDYEFANSLKGKILLQVEAQGQAWYVNPLDGRRYYMASGEAAYQIMRYLGIGITNQDLMNINTSELVPTEQIHSLNTDNALLIGVSYGQWESESFNDFVIDDTSIYAVGYNSSEGKDGSGLLIKFNKDDLYITSKKIYLGDDFERFNSVTVDDQYIYIVGETMSEGYGNSDALIIKLDKEDLSPIYKKIYGGLQGETLTSVKSDSNYLYAVGSTFSEGGGGSDALIIKLLKDNLDIRSKKVFGGYFNDRFEDIALADDSLYAVGATSSEGYYGSEALIVRFKKEDLSILNNKYFGGIGYEWFKAVDYNDNYVYVVGYTTTEGEGAKEGLLVKFSSNLIVMAKKIYGGYAYDWFNSVFVEDDSIYVAGITDSIENDFRNGLVIQFNKNDFSSKAKVLESMYSSFNSILYYNDYIYLAGYLESLTNQDALMVKLDGLPDGNYETIPAKMIWQDVYFESNNSTMVSGISNLTLANSNLNFADSNLNFADSNLDINTYMVYSNSLLPSSLDSDNDGLLDSEEISLGTNINHPDTDGDRLLDGEEVTIWKTNPLLADTDYDGYSDSIELEAGYNPLGSGVVEFGSNYYLLLEDAKIKARNARRLSDAKRLQILLNKYYFDSGIYPETITFGQSLSYEGITYSDRLPTNPEVIANDICPIDSEYIYTYIEVDKSYEILICLEKSYQYSEGEYVAGYYIATPNSFLAQDETTVDEYLTVDEFLAEVGLDTQITEITISNLNVTNIASTTATVNWTTSIAGNSQIRIATNSDDLDLAAWTEVEEFNTTLIEHTASLTGLVIDTLYYIQVKSVGEELESEISDINFTTLSE